MRIETNTRLVTRNRRAAQYLFFFSIAVLIGAFIYTNQQALSQQSLDPNSMEANLLLLLPAIVLPVGVIASMVSVRMTNLWIREPRPERVLKEGLKGLSNKSVMYHYYHFPARHVLICPQGVFAIVTPFQDGRYRVDGDKWKSYGGPLSALVHLFRRDNIGNPGADAQAAAASIQKTLKPIAPEITVRPLVVFIDPKAEIEIHDPVVPVLVTDTKSEYSLKNFMRDVPKEDRQTLTPEQIEAFEAATLKR